jgi:hypothetical protein
LYQQDFSGVCALFPTQADALAESGGSRRDGIRSVTRAIYWSLTGFNPTPRRFFMIKQLSLRPVVLASSLMLALSGVAIAQSRGHGGDFDHGFGARFGADGKIALSEVEANAAKRAAEIDADADGRITTDEIRAHREKMRQARAEKRLARLDSNGDGAVSVDEFAASQTERMAKLDANGDGVIERSELRKRHGDKRHRRASPPAAE